MKREAADPAPLTPHYKKIPMVRVPSGNAILMDYIDKVLEKLKEWTRKLVEALLGPQAEPEPEPIPIPVNDRSRR